MTRLILTLGLVIVSVAGLSACKTTVEGEGYEVEVHDGHHHDGDFCPPGQAKKGHC